MRLSTLALAATLFAPFTAPIAMAEDAPTVTTTNLGNGIYELKTDMAGNVGILIGNEGVFMIDTQMGDLTPLIDDAQRAVSGGQDVELILNTHLHGDHVGGNAYFAKQGAVIMAHPNVRTAMMAPKKSALTGNKSKPYPTRALPTVNITPGDTVTMNDQTAHFYHAPDAHTNSDIFVHFEEANIIHAGDLLFANRFPFIDLDNGGSVQGYIDGMKAILEVAKPDTKIIAGHGPLSSEATLEASIKMLTETHAIIKNLVDSGKTLEQIQKANPLAAYHDDWNWGFITTERMVWTLYRDITGKTE
ncbi:MBL fold metallo-hydrolase [Hirschia litorea]|uniref:beta-lactamase n=1 Tax=Hirschia litorea TaxID=1199156 RepID=A0ABW2IKX4_9PROT